MNLDPRQVEVIDDAMAEVMRRLTPAQKIANAHSMWRYARQRVDAAVRWQHPDWNDRDVQQEISRRMLSGSG
ncbi:MAG TPA: hypothetical protein VKK61_03845 [Tepidisphaeraceae bacterium]|nr:hypothetical protein [Tepidisphaeraceae bacterium]